MTHNDERVRIENFSNLFTIKLHKETREFQSLDQVSLAIHDGPLTAQQAIMCATGSVTRTCGIEGGELSIGSVADLLVLDAPLGRVAKDAFGTVERGDLPAVACVVTDGVVWGQP